MRKTIIWNLNKQNILKVVDNNPAVYYYGVIRYTKEGDINCLTAMNLI